VSARPVPEHSDWPSGDLATTTLHCAPNSAKGGPAPAPRVFSGTAGFRALVAKGVPRRLLQRLLWRTVELPSRPTPVCRGDSCSPARRGLPAPLVAAISVTAFPYERPAGRSARDCDNGIWADGYLSRIPMVRGPLVAGAPRRRASPQEATWFQSRRSWVGGGVSVGREIGHETETIGLGHKWVSDRWLVALRFG